MSRTRSGRPSQRSHASSVFKGVGMDKDDHAEYVIRGTLYRTKASSSKASGPVISRAVIQTMPGVSGGRTYCCKIARTRTAACSDNACARRKITSFRVEDRIPLSTSPDAKNIVNKSPMICLSCIDRFGISISKWYGLARTLASYPSPTVNVRDSNGNVILPEYAVSMSLRAAVSFPEPLGPRNNVGSDSHCMVYIVTHADTFRPADSSIPQA